MQTVKFKAKRKLNGEWVYGSYIHVGNDWCQIVPEGTEYDELNNSMIRVITDTVCQYIGLKDKNGKEMFSGDIGEIRTESGRVERFIIEWGIHRRDMKSGWTVDIPSFCFKIDQFASYPIVNNYINGHDLDIIELVGNIFDDIGS